MESVDMWAHCEKGSDAVRSPIDGALRAADDARSQLDVRAAIGAVPIHASPPPGSLARSSARRAPADTPLRGRRSPLGPMRAVEVAATLAPLGHAGAL